MLLLQFDAVARHHAHRLVDEATIDRLIDAIRWRNCNAADRTAATAAATRRRLRAPAAYFGSATVRPVRHVDEYRCVGDGDAGDLLRTATSRPTATLYVRIMCYVARAPTKKSIDRRLSKRTRRAVEADDLRLCQSMLRSCFVMSMRSSGKRDRQAATDVDRTGSSGNSSGRPSMLR